jgi:hypothetical protein
MLTKIAVCIFVIVILLLYQSHNSGTRLYSNCDLFWVRYYCTFPSCLVSL